MLLWSLSRYAFGKTLSLTWIYIVSFQIKWRSTRREDLTLQGMAKAALSRMEVKKFSNAYKASGGKRRDRHPSCASTTKHSDDIAQNLLEHMPRASSSICGAHETCAICLEDYRNGQVRIC